LIKESRKRTISLKLAGSRGVSVEPEIDGGKDDWVSAANDSPEVSDPVDAPDASRERHESVSGKML